MRIGAIVFLLLAVAATAVAGGPRPTLQLANSPALVVRGAGFAKFEPVKLTAFVRGGPVVRRVTAGPLGGFTVRFDFQRDGCTGGHLIQAVGPKSGLVRLRMSLRECPELQIP